MENKVFKEIIRREIDMMFGGDKQKKSPVPDIAEHTSSLHSSSPSSNSNNSISDGSSKKEKKKVQIKQLAKKP